jgi:hypothetical protein
MTCGPGLETQKMLTAISAENETDRCPVGTIGSRVRRIRSLLLCGLLCGLLRGGLLGGFFRGGLLCSSTSHGGIPSVVSLRSVRIIRTSQL